MKRNYRIIMGFAMVLLLSILFSTVAYANSAEPPSFTVIVSNPLEDLSLSLRFANEGKTEAIVLNEEHKAWETYYRFFYHMSPIGNDNLDDAVLIVQSNEKNFQCSLPADTFNTYNNLLTLDMKTENLTIGQPPLRVPLLVMMRIILTLVIEGVIFFIFGYRKKSSWLAFFAINLVTQGALNVMLTVPSLESYWLLGFIFGEIVVLAVELIAFIFVVKEFGKRRVAVYTVTANAASLIIGGLLITYLPV
ncbi:MAG: hypothetical protein JJE17_11480 [Peptostreptococcaceae bacterium]|nr:hypothetical protein [Peptostreptococcaceae bacterium]